MGLPEFDDQGFYRGPLQKRAASQQLIGQQNSKFNTTGSEQWPSNFCKWIANQILQTAHTSSSCGGGPSQSDVGGAKVKGGEGEPRICRVPGKTKEFHDGAGLASPGRWDLEHRIWNKEPWIVKLRAELLQIIVERCGGHKKLDKVCFDMAVKGESGCEMVKDEKLKHDLLDKMVEALGERGVNTESLLQVAEGQPFRLRLMQSMLQQIGDPDHLFLLDGEIGYSVGVIHQLPRTPHMYEEQTTWKLEDDPYMRDKIWREN